MRFTVGAFGNQDSYSYLAAKWAYGAGVQSLPYTKDVFDEIRNGRVDVGVVPLENISGGWVSDVLYELIRLPETDPETRIIREINLPVVLCVATKGAKTKVATAARIFSHPYPLVHATPWIVENNPRAERVPVASTSLAAEMASKDGDAVALCNLAAARRHGLRVLLASLPSEVQNMTRFVALSKTVPAKGRLSMTSLCFSTLNRPGSLLKAIEVFKKNGINMTRIESRAVESFRSYRFFVELQAAGGGSGLHKALKALKTRTEKLAVLGSYPLDKVPKSKVASLY